jgi:hypothetical protein
MATLLAAHNSEGCIGRCDAKCYNAESAECHCICGGANHGVGYKQAVDNTREMAERWIEEYTKQHPDAVRFDRFPGKPVQFDLFEVEEQKQP